MFWDLQDCLVIVLKVAKVLKEQMAYQGHQGLEVTLVFLVQL